LAEREGALILERTDNQILNAQKISWHIFASFIYYSIDCFDKTTCTLVDKVNNSAGLKIGIFLFLPLTNKMQTSTKMLAFNL
jgi:hypothetical protein